jgi:hypothetical protein
MPRARGAGPARAGPTPGTRQYAAHVAAGAMSGKKQGGELIYRGIPHVTVLETGLAHQSSPPPPTTTDHSGFTTAGKKGKPSTGGPTGRTPGPRWGVGNHFIVTIYILGELPRPSGAVMCSCSGRAECCVTVDA